MQSNFRPAWWLPSSHLQTVWPSLFRRTKRPLQTRRERFELPDGDFLDLDWSLKHEGRPIVLILHGLEGSIDSPYARGMFHAIEDQGWRGLFVHFRSCSGEPNRLPRIYHSGETGDLDVVVKALLQREPKVALGAVGFSLGGNVLLKWLGELGANNPLKAAIAVSVPLELEKAVTRVNKGFSKLYQWHMLRCLLQKMDWKFQEQDPPFPFPSRNAIRTLRDFDEAITAPLHGFTCAADYYQKSSSRQYLPKITVPTLLLQAKDDPLLTHDLLPSDDELPAAVRLELSENGGHVGFVSGTVPWRPEYWLEKRVPLFLQQYL